MYFSKIFTRFIGAVLAVWVGLAQASTGPSAEVMMLTGKGTAGNTAGTVRALAKGQPVYPGELISTGTNSYLNLRFKDGGYILLRPNSRFQIEAFTYDGPEVPLPADAAKAKAAPSVEATPAAPAAPVAAAPKTAPAGSRAFFKLLRGGFRAVSGLIGKGNSNEYRVASPVATIGIRGTDYETFLCDQACQADPVIKEALGRVNAGSRVQPQLLRAALVRATARSGRLIKTQGDDTSQVTFVNDGEVNQIPNSGGPGTKIPKGTGAVTDPSGNTGTFKTKPNAAGNTQDPTDPACN